MELSERQKEIIEVIKEYGPITGEEIAKKIYISKSALRTDFAILNRLNIIISKKKIGYIYNYDSVTEKRLDIKVKNIMGAPIVLEEDISVSKCILYMFKMDIGTLFIVKNNNLVGVVSRKDLLRVTMGNVDIEKIPINMVMTRMPNIICTDEDESIDRCIEKIITHEIDCLPVIKKHNNRIEIVGRVSKTNLVKFLLDILVK